MRLVKKISGDYLWLVVAYITLVLLLEAALLNLYLQVHYADDGDGNRNRRLKIPNQWLTLPIQRFGEQSTSFSELNRN